MNISFTENRFDNHTGGSTAVYQMNLGRDNFKAKTQRPRSQFIADLEAGFVSVTPHNMRKVDIKFVPPQGSTEMYRRGFPNEKTISRNNFVWNGFESWFNSNLQLFRNQSLDLKDKGGMVTSGVAKLNQAELDVATTLGELPETIRMFQSILVSLKNPLKTVNEMIEALKRREWKKLSPEELRDLSKHQRRNLINEGHLKYIRGENSYYKAGVTWNGAWVEIPSFLANLRLMYRYGILPLFYTAQDALKAMEEKDRIWKESRVRDTVQSEWVAPTKFFLNYGEQGIGVKYELVFTKTVTRRFFGKRLYTRAGTYPRLGLNPLTTAWELVRLSFVVDWFINVGDFISALTTPNICMSEGLTFSTQEEITAVLRPVESTWNFINTRGSVFSGKGTYLTLEYKEVSYTREVIGDHFDEIKLTSDVMINWDRAMDALALSWQTIRPLAKNVRKL